jgi:hypothetical protein
MTEPLDKLAEASVNAPARVVLDGEATYLVAMDRYMFVAVDAPFAWIELPQADPAADTALTDVREGDVLRTKHSESEAACVRQMIAKGPVSAIHTTIGRLAEWAGTPEWNYPCSCCKSTGKQVGDCERCKGEGTVTCYCECGDEHERDCPVCDGGGAGTKHDGDTCDRCIGTGHATEIPADGIMRGLVAGIVVDKRRLARMIAVIDKQPVVVWSDTAVLHLRWDGSPPHGHAVLMAVRDDNAEALLDGAFIS